MALGVIALLLLAAAAAQAPIDDFEQPAAWQASASDGVSASAQGVVGANGRALRLTYDFGRVSGYAFVSRVRAIDWPDNYRLRLKMRGTGGTNDLQIKFTDGDGTNVWWARRDGFRPTAAWQEIVLRPRDLSFAWGTSADKKLRRTARIEIVVARGRDGGTGTIELDDLTLEPLPPSAPLPAPTSSDRRVLDGDRDTVAESPDVTIDFGGARELGGLVLDWQGVEPRYRIEASDDRRQWRLLRAVEDSDGGDDPVALPETETRYLRIRATSGRLAEVTVKPFDWGASANAMIAELAKAAPRGAYPRGFTEQSYWTLLGSDGGRRSGLIGEDGAVEVDKGGFSIEPFVIADGKSYRWADVTAMQTMPVVPRPVVTWQGPGFALIATGFAEIDGSALRARWRLENRSARPRRLTLALAVRPFQVNPPAQFLSQQGGVSPIERIDWDGTTLAVRSPGPLAGDAAIERVVRPGVAPTAVTMAPFARGALALAGEGRAVRSLTDPDRLASAVLRYEATLAPGAAIDVPVVIPYSRAGGAANVAADDRARAAVDAAWTKRLGGVAIDVPESKRAVADTLRTALAHVLMSRDGVALKPGTRSYDRSWIRDGAMMSDTLLRLGVDEPARAFADWYGGKLFANGKVPCCVDARGADPVPENDSHGEYIHLVTQLYRFTGDRAALIRDWPRLDAARRYMETLRQSERTAANQRPDTRMRYGLMPPSISHEGYSAKAQYSLWDDFWALTGYRDAAFAARALDKPEASEIERQGRQFAADIHAAIRASVAHFGIDFIPGATSLGDFDATSTTIALDPAGEQRALDQRLLANTFAKQFDRVVARRAPGAAWADYTPYELRNVSALVRLGERTRANRLLDIYMADRRPSGWNQWAEVVGRDPREIRFIGDMPHAWVASDFIRAALDLFAYEDDGRIVLGGGLDRDWLSGSGSTIRGLRTAYGSVDLAIRAEGRTVTVTLGGTARPPKGLLLRPPFEGEPDRVTIDGRPARFGAEGLAVPPGSRTIVIRYPAGAASIGANSPRRATSSAERSMPNIRLNRMR